MKSNILNIATIAALGMAGAQAYAEGESWTFSSRNLEGDYLSDYEFVPNNGKPTTRSFGSTNQEGDKQINYDQSDKGNAAFSSRFEGNYAPNQVEGVDTEGYGRFGTSKTKYEGYIVPGEVDAWEWMDPKEMVEETVTVSEARQMARKQSRQTFHATFWITGIVALVLGIVLTLLAQMIKGKSEEVPSNPEMAVAKAVVEAKTADADDRA